MAVTRYGLPPFCVATKVDLTIIPSLCHIFQIIAKNKMMSIAGMMQEPANLVSFNADAVTVALRKELKYDWANDVWV